MEAIILAGGKGTRLQSEVSDRPKPLASVGDKPFLEHLLTFWSAQGVEHFILSVGHLREKITTHFGKHWNQSRISYSEETEPLGTGGGFLKAIEQLETNQTTLLLNGDSFLSVDPREMKKFHLDKKSVFTLALSHVAQNTRYGSVETDSEGRCLSFGKAPLAGTPVCESDINGGVYLFEPDQVARWKKNSAAGMISLEGELIPAAIARREPIYGWKTRGRFIDIGTPEDYARAQSFFKEGGF